MELGIPIAAGTDTGEVGVTADMVAREMPCCMSTGHRRWRRSRRGRRPRRDFSVSISEIGRVAPGYLADLVLVGGDPVTDLGRLAEPILVLQSGRSVREAELLVDEGAHCQGSESASRLSPWKPSGVVSSSCHVSESRFVCQTSQREPMVTASGAP